MLDTRLRATPGYDAWLGREASSAAVSCCLRRADSVIPTPRATLAQYLHTGALPLSSSVSDPAAHFAAATEAALRHKAEKRGGLAVLFTRPVKPASMREAFASAAKKSLPVLCILEGAAPSAEVSSGIPVIRVDASDTVALYRVAFESIARARERVGPTILECAAWPDDPEPDPLLKLEGYLAAKKLFRPHWKHQLEKKFLAALD
ncbi:MAG TPA: thiamine pyrophosphate-dependent enzyme [Acidobacteriaceae bacterium]|nr:thiamine pyrophosphate-dependent enzyme [Acidobacteriaceae bacterium]